MLAVLRKLSASRDKLPNKRLRVHVDAVCNVAEFSAEQEQQSMGAVQETAQTTEVNNDDDVAVEASTQQGQPQHTATHLSASGLLKSSGTNSLMRLRRATSTVAFCVAGTSPCRVDTSNCDAQASNAWNQPQKTLQSTQVWTHRGRNAEGAELVSAEPAASNDGWLQFPLCSGGGRPWPSDRSRHGGACANWHTARHELP